MNSRYFWALLLISISSARAADVICATPSVGTQINTAFIVGQSRKGCLGGTNDKNELSVFLGEKFKSLNLERSAESPPERQPSRDDLVSLMRVAIPVLEAYVEAHPPPFKDKSLEQYQRQMQQTLAALRENADLLLPPAADSKFDSLRRDKTDSGLSLMSLGNPKTYATNAEVDEKIIVQFSAIDPKWSNLSLKDGESKGPLKGPCMGATPSACNAAGTYVAELIRVSRLTSRIIRNTVARLPLLKVGDEIKKIDNQWDSYFNEARSQTFLELFVNGRLWKGSKSDAGFASAPTGQLILLHPGVSLEYVNSAPDGDQFKPAVHIEGIGYNWLHYNDDGTMGRALGFSLGVIYADRASVPDVRPAAFFIWDNDYSIGVTFGGGSTGVLLSGDLLALGKKIKTKYRDRLRTRTSWGLFD